MVKQNKLTPNFDPAAHTVTSVHGGDVIVKDYCTGKEYRRNVIHLKKVKEGEWAALMSTKVGTRRKSK